MLQEKRSTKSPSKAARYLFSTSSRQKPTCTRQSCLSRLPRDAQGPRSVEPPSQRCREQGERAGAGNRRRAVLIPGASETLDDVVMKGLTARGRSKYFPSPEEYDETEEDEESAGENAILAESGKAPIGACASDDGKEHVGHLERGNQESVHAVTWTARGQVSVGWRW